MGNQSILSTGKSLPSDDDDDTGRSRVRQFLVFVNRKTASILNYF